MKRLWVFALAMLMLCSVLTGVQAKEALDGAEEVYIEKYEDEVPDLMTQFYRSGGLQTPAVSDPRIWGCLVLRQPRCAFRT